MNDTPVPIAWEDLQDPKRLTAIYSNPQERYWTTDWSPETYIAMARAGFIGIRVPFQNIGLLWLRLHQRYAVLEWENLRIGKSLQRWTRSQAFREQGFTLSVHHDINPIVAGITKEHGSLNWMVAEYSELMRRLFPMEANPEFTLMTTGLVNRQGELAAGEIGYRIGRVYTSLSGFLRVTSCGCGLAHSPTCCWSR